MKVHNINAVYKDGTVATVRTCSYIKVALFKTKFRKSGLGEIVQLTVDGKEVKVDGTRDN